MSATFDLLTHPWLPCLQPDGAERLCSLTETLLRAPELAEIADPSPMVTAALHRLLLAVVHRVFGPAETAAWHRLWRRGEWPRAELEDYLARWGDRFDLFSETHPFYQVVGLPSRLSAPASRLVLDRASGNRATLFDHSRDGSAGGLSPAAAARHLVAYQQYCLGGRCGSERGLATVRSGPLAHAALFLVGGRNLFETLMLNLVPYSPEREAPWPCHAEDRPVWEREAAETSAVGPPAGYLDYLTWPSRRLRLVPTRDVGGEFVVREVCVSAGRDLAPDDPLPDPARAWRAVPVSGRRSEVWRPLALLRGDSWWRTGARLIAATEGPFSRPPVLGWLEHLMAHGCLPADYPGRLETIGLTAYRARVLAWSHLRQPLPLAYLRDPELSADLEHCLALAERTAAALAEALRALSDPGSGRGLERFWRGLEPDFVALLERLPGDLRHRSELLAEWASHCGRAARAAFRLGRRGDTGGVRDLRLAVETEARLARRLYGQVLRPYLGEVVDVAH